MLVYLSWFRNRKKIEIILAYVSLANYSGRINNTTGNRQVTNNDRKQYASIMQEISEMVSLGIVSSAKATKAQALISREFDDIRHMRVSDAADLLLALV